MTAPRQRPANWFDNISITKKAVLILGVLVSAQLMAALAFLYVMHEENDAQQWTYHTYKVIDSIEDLKGISRDRDKLLATYAVTQSPETRSAYEAALEQSYKALDAIRSLTVDNPGQQARTAQLLTSIKRWDQEVGQYSMHLAVEQHQRDISVERGQLEKNAADLTSVMETAYSAMIENERSLLAQRSQRLDSITHSGHVFVAAVLLLSVAFGLIAQYAANTLLIGPLSQITGQMSRLTQDDLDVDIPWLDRGDELGAMARALKIFRDLSADMRGQNWAKESIATISNRLQSAVAEREFAEVLTGDLAPLLEIGFGVLYIFDAAGEYLELLGSYGYRTRRHVTPRYKLGEGLVGQCGREHKTIVLDHVPSDYMSIHSGLGEAPPSTVIVLPILAQDRLLGVVEFASFARFSPLQQHLLDELLPTVALSLENLQRAIRTQQLLEESRAQAEALKASEETLRMQQEEMRAVNEALHSRSEELQAQSIKLKTSEEELRVQAEELMATNSELRDKSETLNRQKDVLESLQLDTEEKAAELARASQYKSDFLANMSHELRTPLNSLLILSRSLADNDEGNLNAEQIESAQIMHDSGSNLLHLINDILDLSKVEAGKIELVLDEMPLEVFSNALMRNFRHVAQEKGLALEISIAPGLPSAIITDSARLEQIANNLIGNALKFTRTGAVRVHIGRPAADQLPAGSVSDTERGVAIAVSDTGIGIPPDKFGKVFQAFEQVDGSTSRQFGGTGLGLSISRGLAHLLGGDIRLHSVVGQGTTFTLVLPHTLNIATAPAHDSRPTRHSMAAPPKAPGQSPAAILPLTPAPIPDDRDALSPGDTVILVVEDDPAFIRILADMVHRRGFKVLTAADGESGLALAQHFHPTGVLLDASLPRMDGWTVMDRLKSDAATRPIPVHFVSASDEHARGLELGAVGFLTKPVTREAITSAFDRLLHFAEGQPRHVLIVDDDPGSRTAVRRLVGGEHVHIKEAASAEDALALLAQEQFDCIVLDLGLPGMDGFEFLEHASKLPGSPPVVVYSGRELTPEETLRLRQYTDSIVVKGVRSPERLLDEVSLFLHSIRTEAPPAPESASDLTGKIALIVDDDMRNVFALSKALRSKGLKIVMAQDGHKALKQLDDNADIEIVLMDIMMPGMDGYETTRQIRAQTRFANLPIIALTAKAMRGDREKCLEAGASDYLSKPIDISKLLSVMRVWLH